MTRLAPGSTLGILGGGQLARMMAMEAQRMGYRVAVLDPNPHPPAAPFVDRCIQGTFDDVDAAKLLSECSDVVTLDTEHIPADLLDQLEPIAPVRPSARVLRTIQDRRDQREFLDEIGVPQVPTAPVHDQASLREAAQVCGFPCVLKTRRSGYDGKGQARVAQESELESAWASIGESPAVMESFIEFECEVSVLLARDIDGNVRFHAVAENDHRNHILHTTRVPARISDELTRAAHDIGLSIVTALDYVGMMAVELFVTRDGRLLVNEVAPRTHNSGHYTLGACITSQFEQHVRAVCGLPLGDPTLLRPAVMLNVLGDSWKNGEAPPWHVVEDHPMAKLHLYGKTAPSKGRKMGHVLVLGDDDTAPMDSVDAISNALG